MTDEQKKICQYLINQSYDFGFSIGHSLVPIAAKLGVTALAIYDDNTEKGIIAEYVSNGFLSARNGCISVNRDTHELLENWARD